MVAASARTDEVPPRLRAALTACRRNVVNAGGAVGFAELRPVRDEDVAPVVDEVVAGLDPPPSTDAATRC